MILQEHLLCILAEECSEVAHRASKALRFGLREVQKGQELTNAERIIYEFSDLYAVMMYLHEQGLLPTPFINHEMVSQKLKKLDEFLEYSKQMGTLTE
jgi:hypothetical protein